MIIYLVRHGLSLGNIAGKNQHLFTGRADNSSLTLKGRHQIKDLAQSFFDQKITIDKIFSSPLKRTIQSAKIFQEFYPQTEIIIDPDLVDIDFGYFAFKKWGEIKNQYPDWVGQFKKDPVNTSFPQGESIKEIQDRVKKFIKNRLNNNKARYIIITHEAVIRSFLSLFSPDDFLKPPVFFSIPNASCNSIFFQKNKSYIFQLNDKKPVNLPANLLVSIFNYLRHCKINSFYLSNQNSYSLNHIFLVVEKNSKYILKIIPKIKTENLKKDIEISHLLHQKKFNIPQWKNFYQNYKIFILRSYDENLLGSFFLINKKYSFKIVELMAKTLANIHHQTKFLKAYFKKQNNFYDNRTWNKKFIPNWLRADLKILKKINNPNYSFVEKVFSINLKLLPWPIKEGFIYFDFHPENFTVKKIKDNFILSSFWDFENSFWGDTRFDLAYTIKLSFFKNIKLINFFLKTYYEEKISPKEKSIIFFYLLMITTGSITYKIKNNIDYREETENLDFFIKHYLKFLKYH